MRDSLFYILGMLLVSVTCLFGCGESTPEPPTSTESTERVYVQPVFPERALEEAHDRIHELELHDEDFSLEAFKDFLASLDSLAQTPLVGDTTEAEAYRKAQSALASSLESIGDPDFMTETEISLTLDALHVNIGNLVEAAGVETHDHGHDHDHDHDHDDHHHD